MCRHEEVLFRCNLDLFGKSQETSSANSVWNSRWDDPFLARSCWAVSTGTRTQKEKRIGCNSCFKTFQSGVFFWATAPSVSLKYATESGAPPPLSKLDHLIGCSDWLQICQTSRAQWLSHWIFTVYKSGLNVFLTLHVHAGGKQKSYKKKSDRLSTNVLYLCRGDHKAAFVDSAVFLFHCWCFGASLPKAECEKLAGKRSIREKQEAWREFL